MLKGKKSLEMQCDELKRTAEGGRLQFQKMIH